MRTKTLLITAALSLAAAATSMAQAVYSINIVGYVNLTMQPGNNAVANQLKAGNNSLNAVLPNAPFLAQVLTLVGSDYKVDVCDGAGSWFDNASGDPSTTLIPPGKGFFYNNPNATPDVVTFVGEVTTGNGLSVAIPNGLSFLGTITPQALSLVPSNNFPAVFLMQYLTYNRTNQTYDILVNDGTGAWFDNATGNGPLDATPQIGQGFFISNPEAATAWTRNFNP